jgi:hypothetical protein
LYITTARFCFDAGDECTLQLFREFWMPKVLPTGFLRRTEVIKIKCVATITTSEMTEHMRPHYRPPEAGTVTDRVSDVLDRGNAALHEVERFLIECSAEPISYMPDRFPA